MWISIYLHSLLKLLRLVWLFLLWFLFPVLINPLSFSLSLQESLFTACCLWLRIFLQLYFLVFKARNILMPVCLCSPTVVLWHCLLYSPSLEMMPSSITQFCICHTIYYSLPLAVIYYPKMEKQHSHSNHNSSYLQVLFHPWLRLFYSLHIYSCQNASAVLFPLLEAL